MLNDNRFDLAATRVARLATLANGIVAANPLSIAPVSPTLTMGLFQNARLSSLVRGISMANRINSTPSISAIITNPPRITQLDSPVRTTIAANRISIAPSIPAIIANPPHISLLNSLARTLVATKHLSIAPVIPTLAAGLPQISLLNSLVRTLVTAHHFNVFSLSPTLVEFFESFRKGMQLENNGWSPHRTFPRHLLTEIDSSDVTDEIILDYYRDNWVWIREIIEEDISEYLVDDDAKGALHQALVAHEKGLYRLVCATLFAEMERALRVCLYDNQVGRISIVKQIKDNFGVLPSAVFPDRALGLVGFRQLINHVYESIPTDADRERFSDSPVPNRHAAIHGLVTYSSEKSSLNTIFIAAYFFQLLTATKMSQRSTTDSHNAIAP